VKRQTKTLRIQHGKVNKLGKKSGINYKIIYSNRQTKLAFKCDAAQ